MAIDLRADVNCSLGTLISGSISDSYIQGSGLVTSQGSAEISGLITPEIGTEVTFTYTKNSVTKTIPKRMRVLSSFADPFKRTTSVELGCKLTYLSDLTEEIDWTAYDDIENNELPDDERVLAPIYASSVMNECLSKLGITASSNPLTNRFSIPRFDFSSGYVQILGDLLVSESYFGYLDEDEVLQIVYLSLAPEAGAVYTSNDIIELGPINSGDLPGQAVVVSYSTLKLKSPAATGEDLELINWEKEEITGDPYEIRIPYDDNNSTAVYTGIDHSLSETSYRILRKQFFLTPATTNFFGGSFRGSISKVAELEVKDEQVTTTSGPVVKEIQQIAAVYLENGIQFINSNGVLEKTIQKYTYDENTGEPIGSETTYYKNSAAAYSQLDLPWFFGTNDYVIFGYGLMIVGRTIEETVTIGDYRKTVTKTYRWWPETTSGQQAIAELKEVFGSAAEVVSYCEGIHEVLVLENVDVSTSNSGRTINGRPPAIVRANAFSSKIGAIAENFWRTESKAELELVFGSATAQRRIEFAMPYASDDFYFSDQFGVSDAETKANRYGRVQNQLLLGNRNGASIQMAPEKMPDAPFTPMYVQANGLTAMYRSNGSQWAFSAEGIVCSVDALFWGAVGGTGDFWFPVAPGIVSLPETPPVVGGIMTPTVLVPAYNEIAIYELNLRVQIEVTKYNYELDLLTEVPTMTVRTLLSLGTSIKLFAASSAFTVTGIASLARTNYRMTASNGTYSLTGIAAEFIIPRIFADKGTFNVSGIAAALTRPGGDPYWSQVALLLKFEGGTTDSGPLATPTSFTSLTTIDTAKAKFGSSSLRTTNTNSYIAYADSPTWTLGGGDFTIEAWVWPTYSFGYHPILAAHRGSGGSNFGYFWWFSTGGSNYFEYDTDGVTGRPYAEFLGDPLPTTEWTHVAICRSGPDLRSFRNGVQVGSTYNIGTQVIYNSTGGFYIGYSVESSTSYDGWLDEYRFTKAARYTSNFAVPTTPFPTYAG